MQVAINILLSGNPVPYMYACEEKALENRNVGDKVVIPNKAKDDGSLSMSIGTYQGIAPTGSPGALKPIVQFIDADAYRLAQVTVLRMEAAARGTDA